MRKDIRTIITQIRRLQAQRAQILEALLAVDPFITGSLSQVKRRCGKPNCHCTKEPAHPVWVLSTSKAGARRCQVVRLADVHQVQRLVASYKQFRAGRQALQATHKTERTLLRGLMEERSIPYE